MNDDYEKGFQDGREMGYRDGFAKGWHDAMRVKAQQETKIDTTPRSLLNVCPKCNVTMNGSVGYVCSSWGCPMKATSESKSIYGET
jgi:hypothetical protein